MVAGLGVGTLPDLSHFGKLAYHFGSKVIKGENQERDKR